MITTQMVLTYNPVQLDRSNSRTWTLYCAHTVAVAAFTTIADAATASSGRAPAAVASVSQAAMNG